MFKKFLTARGFFICAVCVCAVAAFAPPMARVMRLPEDIWLPEGYTAVFAGGTKPIGGDIRVDAEEGGGEKLTVRVFGLPLKTVSLSRVQGVTLVPGGVTAGVRFDTDGVMVLGTGEVTDASGETRRPADGLLKAGDVILEAGGKPLENKEQLMALVAESNGAALPLKIKRDGQTRKASVTPVLSKDDRVYRLGVWLRDSTQGIGTITYYNPSTMTFGALGHGIMDVDTKRLLPVKSGQIYPSNIVSVRKGKQGAPGELIGTQSRSGTIGDILLNTPFGLYGSLRRAPEGEALPIGLQEQARVGPAQIRANVMGTETRDYDIYIESVSKYGGDDAKGMVVRVTDPALIAATNGIVQGMSGSPIIQDGRVIGAVTHVFVQNPLKGYGVFIEHMLKQEQGMKNVS